MEARNQVPNQLGRWLVMLVALFVAGAAGAQSCGIEVLGAAQREQAHEDDRDLLVDPGTYQRRLVERATQYMTPLLCAGVEGVAFIEKEPEDAGATGWVYVSDRNDLVNLDARPLSLSETALNPATNRGSPGDVWAGGIDAILHEGTHATVNLLHSQSTFERCVLFGASCSRVDASQWAPEALVLARQTVQHARLGAGFAEEWIRLHEAFVHQGMAIAFGEYEGSQHDAGALTRAGFTSLYGSTKPGEDIAEWVAKVQTGDLQGATFEGATVGNAGEDLGCLVMRGDGTSVTPRNVAAFTKVAFLRDVGLVSQEAYARCIGDLRIETFGADGVHLTNSSGGVGTLDAAMRAVIGQDAEGAWTFQLTAEGSAHFGDTPSPAKATLAIVLAPQSATLEEVSWPRGIYVIGQDASFRVDIEDAPAGSFVGTRGFVLVTRANGDLLEGSIVLQQAVRPGAFGVPESGSWLPEAITFRMEGGRGTAP